MSAASDGHFDQARQNRALAEELMAQHAGSPTHVKWAVTAAFYPALHCIQGHLTLRGRDPRNHRARDNEIADPANQIPLDVQIAYEALKPTSERARYRLGVFDPNWVRANIFSRKPRTITDFVGL